MVCIHDWDDLPAIVQGDLPHELSILLDEPGYGDSLIHG